MRFPKPCPSILSHKNWVPLSASTDNSNRVWTCYLCLSKTFRSPLFPCFPLHSLWTDSPCQGAGHRVVELSKLKAYSRPIHLPPPLIPKTVHIKLLLSTQAYRHMLRSVDKMAKYVLQAPVGGETLPRHRRLPPCVEEGPSWQGARLSRGGLVEKTGKMALCVQFVLEKLQR